ncbi:subunit 17 of mediator complex-domain-containing protein [Chaetomidium leptoderma]|uniref:Mediator of RNA polymerase II transcription subunit 17 n=1 Tax=Chaetomidium leptoderma TaxID=669021 RepID=A0AAN6ZYX4_9PEZI|nr:subunit 17 of mediator complex-domain-containing protein [Chaetomidium leptoderma]
MNDRPFTLQPRSAPPQGPQSIDDFIRQLHAEPGGFRAVDAAELRRETEANGGHQNGTAGDHDVDMTADASDANSDVAETKDIATAREELLRAIHQTHQTSLFALDFVSLLLSKEHPAQAVTTFSPGLRDMVGIGTLGATMLDAPTALTQSRVPDNKLMAIGKRLMDLNKAADTALAASKRLQREIGSETKYWSEVLGVSEDGWQTFRLPHEPHTLGVKFGFSNTSPEFKNSGIAPLRRAEDGSVRLEHATMGGGSKRLQVSILENGMVVGRSSLSQPVLPDAPLQDRVHELRDTVFAQELWHEINREARVVLDSVVRVAESTAAYDLDATRSISLQLVTLGEEKVTTAEHSGAQDAVANELCIILGLLLSNAHRANELKRSAPSVKKGSTPPYTILRPLIAYHRYDQSVQQCAQSLAELISVLRSASVASSITMKEPPLTTLPGTTTTTTHRASTSLAGLLLKPPPVQFDLAITPASRLRILLRPTLLAGAVYSLSFLPALQPQPGSSPINPLAALSPSSSSGGSGGDEYADLDKLLAYLHDTIPRALAAAYYDLARTVTGPPSPPSSDDEDDGSDGGVQQPIWAMDASSKGVVGQDTGAEYGVHFGFGRDKGTGELAVSVEGDFIEGGKKVHREWKWPGAVEHLSAAVKHVLGNGPGQ